MPLYRATFRIEMVVEAEDRGDAHSQFEDHLSSAVSDGDYQPDFIHEIRDEADIPDGWDDAIPYGGDCARTCSEILAAPPPSAPKETSDE